MGYHALSCLQDAVAATKAFLLPVDRSRWLGLVVVVFFLSGGAGVGSVPNVLGQFSAGAGVVDAGGDSVADVSAAISDVSIDRLLPLVVGLVVVIALVALVFVLVGSVMEFVLVDALRTESVTVRASARRYLGAGLALFAFRVCLGLVLFGLLGGLTYLFVLPAVDAGGVQLALAILLVLGVAVVVGLVAALLHGLTVEFVVPVMVHEERGLVAGWRRFWPVLWENLGQVAVYLIVRFGLAILVGVVASTVVGIAGAVLAIPFLLVGGSLFLGVGGPLTLSTGLAIGAVVVGYVLVLLATASVVQVPLKTFTRYYELLVLGDIDADLDLVAERRASVRETE